MTAETLSGGFADPARDGARAFRALLDAMARPGTVHRLAGALPPAPLPPAAGALALALCDADAPVWLAPRLRTAAVEGWLAFHAGAPLTTRDRAAFAFGTPADLLPVDDFAAGTADYPDRSATLVALIDGFEGEAAAVQGPGVRGTARLALGGDLPGVLALAAPNREAFPLGRDLFLVAGDRVAALPRTARLEREG